MRKYANFDEYFADQSERNRTIIAGLRRLVKRIAPELSEFVKWGNGCWVANGEPVAFVYCRPEYVEFGFFRATALDDPGTLLEGKGAYVRHVRMRTPRDAARPGVAQLLRDAADLAGTPRRGARSGAATMKGGATRKRPPRGGATA